jgi:hypothetical protein
MRCEGDACEVVEVQWDNSMKVYLIRNKSPRKVCVQFRSWSATIALTLSGWDTAEVDVLAFDDPYTAFFCEEGS